MVQTDEPQVGPSPGSIADVSSRLALWSRRATKGLARVEFVSDFSRQAAVSELRETLPQNFPIHEIELPFQRPAIEVAHVLRERLRKLPAGVVSVTGFATAFSDDQPLADSLRVLNFHRENLALFPLCQIWWMTYPFAEVFLRSVPDLDSWFMVRLCLKEALVDNSVEAPPLENNDTYNPEEARKLSAAYVARFEQAMNDNVIANSVIHLAFVAISILGNASLDQEEKELATALLNRMMPQLRKLGLLEENSQFLRPKVKTPPIFGGNYLTQIEDFRMLGQVCECSGDLDGAEAFFKASLETAENYSWPGFDVLGLAFHSLKEFYLRQERFLEAELLCERWLNRQESALGPDSFDVLHILDELLEVYLLEEKYDIAEQIYHRMLNSSKKAAVQNQSLEISLLNNMSWLYTRLGRYAEAKLLSDRAARIQETL